MAKRKPADRANQRHRTRKDLLAAAARLIKEGKTPDMDQVAAEAMVSRATAYRYFPSVEALLVEAPLDGQVPAPSDIFEGDDTHDIAARVEKAEAVLHDMSVQNEGQLRLMLAASLQRHAGGEGIPVRQNRRTPLIEEALAPAKKQLPRGTYENLCAALAMVFGTESMIVFRDVLGVDHKTAQRVKKWACRALVNAALQEAESRR